MSTAVHWADVYAEKVIREKGDKGEYVCASGITPSGTVHIGNFREIISVDLVVRALRERGKKVRFIYSWDDYDVFRKVPANMPRQELLVEYLRKPITMTPDPFGVEESYARHNEREVEELLAVVGIEPEYIYQARAYRSSTYADGIRTALEHRAQLRGILNEYRSKEKLPEDWWPVTVFCNSCSRDTTEIAAWDGADGLSYRCSSCGNEERVDLRKTGAVKLFWRIDWPMRWVYERVDFEPAGKDHHSHGGSFDTGKRIVEEVYGSAAPTSFAYDFIRIKGGSGKISSSSGEVVSLRDMLEIYQPELVRYLFASTRPNSEFAVSFDLDVIKIYEDYDRCERISFGQEPVGEERAAKERRIYELSQVQAVPEAMPEATPEAVPEATPLQVPFRHLCNLVQIHDSQVEPVLDRLELPPGSGDRRRVGARAACAANWIRLYAPEAFRFSVRAAGSPPVAVNDMGRKALRLLREEVDQKLQSHDEKSLGERVYALAAEAGLDPKDLFKVVYRALIDKEAGPRLAGFLLTLGRERVLALLQEY